MEYLQLFHDNSSYNKSYVIRKVLVSCYLVPKFLGGDWSLCSLGCDTLCLPFT